MISCNLIFVLFVPSVIPYRAVIIPIKKLSNAMTTSNPWLCVSGELGDSGTLQITKNVLEMTFDVSAVMSRSSCSALKLIQQFISSVYFPVGLKQSSVLPSAELTVLAGLSNIC